MHSPKPDPLQRHAADEADAESPASGRNARPARLPVWKCHRCGARKRLRNASRD